MNWKIGQKLVCIEDDWTYGIAGISAPKLGDIITFDGFVDCYEGLFLFLKEYNIKARTHNGRKSYRASFFRPLLGESAVSELVSSFKEVTETSDCPMIPETETA